MSEKVIVARWNPIGLPEGESGATAPQLLMVMPGGVHEISVTKGDEPIRLHVQVDQGTAATLQRTLRGHIAKGRKPYFDFDHAESGASAWPEEFVWMSSPQPGVYARVSWSKAGAEAVAGKSFRSFSPSFLVDRYVTDAGNPARVTGAPVVMGGLVNEPGFEAISPLWAKKNVGGGAFGESALPEKGNVMGEKELADLKAKLVDLEQEIVAIKAKKAEGEGEDAIRARAAEVRAKESEAELTRVKIEAAEKDKKIVELEASIKAKNKAVADEAVKAAVKRGAIAPKDEAIQARYRALIEQDPANVVLVESLPVNPALQGAIITAGRAQVECLSEDPVNVIRAYGAEPGSKARGEIYARGLRKVMVTEEGFDHVIRAATNTMGTVVGGLVVQRALDLLKIAFPVLSRISTNFSGENAAKGEAITTRLVSVPTVGTYHATNGYVSQNTTVTDVPVTIDAHQFCQVEFNADEIAGTRRLIFGEQEDGMHYALGKDLVDALYALITTANFTETPTTEALVDFDRSTVIDIGTAMQSSSAGRNANTGTRTLLLSSRYYGQLAQDVVIVGNQYNAGSGSAIATGVLPMVHGFLPVEAPNLPTTGNLTGFGCRADALAMAVRPANDYASALPGVPSTAVVSQVTNPDTGLTVSLVQFVDHYLGKAYYRLAWMRGVAKGNAMAGQILRSGA